MRRIIQQALVIFCVIVLAGCSILKPTKPIPSSNYQLNSIPKNVPKRSRHSVTLLVSTPTTKPVYNTTKMMYSKRRYQVSTFGLNKWVKTPSQMLQPLIVQTLQRTGYFHAIVAPPHIGHHDYTLSTQIFELLQDYTHRPPLLRLSVHAQISKTTTNKVIASDVFNVNQPIRQRTAYGGVVAANYATAIILTKLARFTLSAVGDGNDNEK